MNLLGIATSSPHRTMRSYIFASNTPEFCVEPSGRLMGGLPPLGPTNDRSGAGTKGDADVRSRRTDRIRTRNGIVRRRSTSAG